ncbi:hypothetical protein [Pseudomonas chlororaphis]|uniref:hypothetical protein n=1 Tax=Pseudomonas chlororaphis TaxID=587753 RepID=UPI001B316CF6|nr:hypothetical protein [Pseudomonas chlororaphis]QTT89693.1 hypothetical protein HUT28_20660 [Pseudomonas chlororaphis]
MDNEYEGRNRNFIATVELLRDELDEERGGWVIFDSFSEDLVGSFFRHINRFNDRFFYKAINSGLLSLRVPLKKFVSRFPDVAEFDGGGWFRLSVSSSSGGDSIPAEVVLFGDNVETPLVGVTKLERIDGEFSYWLNLVFMLNGEPRAPASFIAGVLDVSLVDSGGIAVAVYDVGQGNCNAIVDEYEHPRIFFDLGWAPNFHASTRPAGQPVLFACDLGLVPPVILSHWDMDHWSYAIARSRFDQASLTTKHEWHPEALARLWIARAPEAEQHKLGPLALSFYAALTERIIYPGVSAMLLWPTDSKRIDFSAGWLEVCEPGAGSPNDRNNSGLAMFVRPNKSNGAVLLTGDADFTSIPSLLKTRKPPLAGIVAPHHGSYITEYAIPTPKKGGPARLVMSVGNGNSYGHPKQQAIDAYKSKHWNLVLTQNRFECDRCGKSHTHGNTLLKFSSSSPDPECRCKCVLEGNLCLVPSNVSNPAPIAGTKTKRRGRKSKKAVLSV